MYDFLPPIFAGLAAAAIATALQCLETVAVEPGMRLIEEGDMDNVGVVVHTGEVEVRTGGKPLEQVGADGMLGEMALFAAGIRAATVNSLRALGPDPCDHFLRAKPPLAFAILGSAQLVHANRQLARLAHPSNFSLRARVDAHGHYPAEDEDLPDHSMGVDQPW